MQVFDQSLKERLDQVYWSIYLYNTSLTELRIISDIPFNQSELLIANSHTFNFYRVTLQYSFIMEYNKLLEKGRIDRKQHISSLYQLNEVIHSSCGKAFEAKFIENEAKLSKIKATDFYNKIRVLRDKKFAHADDHEVNLPFKVKGFKSEDIEQGFSHLRFIREILKSCTSVYNFEYPLDIPDRDNRTENFIRLQAKYQEYYSNNFYKRSE